MNRPLEAGDDGSLEALQATPAQGHATQGRFLAARPFFKHAIELDPNFAMAYYYVSTAYNNAGDTGRQTEYSKKAFALIDRVSEYEREKIAGSYYETTGELDKTIDAYRLGIASYPRDWGFHNTLSDIYMNLGEFEDGLKEGPAANQLQPNAEPPYRRLLDGYLNLDRLDEAKKVADKLRTLGIGGARIHQRFLEMAIIEGDQAAIDREIQWYSGRPEEYLSFGLQAANLEYSWPASRVEQTVQAGRGDSAAPRAHRRRGRLRRSGCACRRALRQLHHRTSSRASPTRARAVRRCRGGRKARRRDLKASSQWNHLERGATP